MSLANEMKNYKKLIKLKLIQYGLLYGNPEDVESHDDIVQKPTGGEEENLDCSDEEDEEEKSEDGQMDEDMGGNTLEDTFKKFD